MLAHKSEMVMQPKVISDQILLFLFQFCAFREWDSIPKCGITKTKVIIIAKNSTQEKTEVLFKKWLKPEQSRIES